MMDRQHPLGVAWHPNWSAAERKLLQLRATRRRLLFPSARRPLLARLKSWLAEFVA